MFDTYISMDPALYWNDKALLRNASERLKVMPKRNIKLWFAGSDAGDIYPHTEKLSKILELEAISTLEALWFELPAKF